MNEPQIRAIENQGQIQHIYTSPESGKIIKIVGPDEITVVYDWNENGQLIGYTQNPKKDYLTIIWQEFNNHPLAILTKLNRVSDSWELEKEKIEVLANSTLGKLTFDFVEVQKPILTPGEAPLPYSPWLHRTPFPQESYYAATYLPTHNPEEFEVNLDRITFGSRRILVKRDRLFDSNTLTIFPKTLVLPSNIPLPK